MKLCPYCEGYMSEDDHSISLVETHVNNFENSQAAECDHCGLRAMSADINDGDEQAFKFWDDLVDSINAAARVGELEELLNGMLDGHGWVNNNTLYPTPEECECFDCAKARAALAKGAK